VSEESAEGQRAVRKEVEVEAAGASIVAVASLGEGGEEEASGWWRAVGEVWVNGVGVEWERAQEGSARRRVGLPTYPFERAPYWIERREGVGEDKAVREGAR